MHPRTAVRLLLVGFGAAFLLAAAGVALGGVNISLSKDIDHDLKKMASASDLDRLEAAVDALAKMSTDQSQAISALAAPGPYEEFRLLGTFPLGNDRNASYVAFSADGRTAYVEWNRYLLNDPVTSQQFKDSGIVAIDIQLGPMSAALTSKGEVSGPRDGGAQEPGSVLDMSSSKFQGRVFAEPWGIWNIENGRSVKGGIALYDVTNPKNIKTLSQTIYDGSPSTDGGPPGTTPANGLNLAAGGTMMFYHVNTNQYIMYWQQSPGVWTVFNIDDPKKPILLGTIPFQNYFSAGLTLQSGVAPYDGLGLHLCRIARNAVGQQIVLWSGFDFGPVVFNIDANPLVPVFVAHSTVATPDPVDPTQPRRGGNHGVDFAPAESLVWAADRCVKSSQSTLINSGPCAGYSAIWSNSVSAPLSAGAHVFPVGTIIAVGEGCTGLPPAPGPGYTALAFFGTPSSCGSATKSNAAAAAGYQTLLIAAAPSASLNCQVPDAVQSYAGSATGARTAGIGRGSAVRLFGSSNCLTGVPAVGSASTADFTLNPVLFMSWGRLGLHAFDQGAGSITEKATIAVPAALNPALINAVPNVVRASAIDGEVAVFSHHQIGIYAIRATPGGGGSYTLAVADSTEFADGLHFDAIDIDYVKVGARELIGVADVENSRFLLFEWI